MSASYPDMLSLGEARCQFLSTGRLPEDEFGDEGSPKRRDVFLTAVAMHRILLGTSPRSPNGFPEWDAGIDVTGDCGELYDWFAQALACEPKPRHDAAGEALAMFNGETGMRPRRSGERLLGKEGVITCEYKESTY